jgi:hypothetical protein
MSWLLPFSWHDAGNGQVTNKRYRRKQRNARVSNTRLHAAEQQSRNLIALFLMDTTVNNFPEGCVCFFLCL